MRFDLRTYSITDPLVFEDYIPCWDPYIDVEAVIAGAEL